jgi:phospholipid/cholesterol/gamma-HCH transport system substrate-binding protein
MNRSLIETVLGGVVLAIAALFVVFAYNTSTLKGSNGQGYALKANFNKIDGISVGSDVRISGIKVGTVTNLALNPQTFQADMSINVKKDVLLPTDTVIKVESEGLLGGHFISLVPGGEEEVLKEGAIFAFAESPTSLSELLSRFVFSAAEKKNDKTSDAPSGGGQADTLP